MTVIGTCLGVVAMHTTWLTANYSNPSVCRCKGQHTSKLAAVEPYAGA